MFKYIYIYTDVHTNTHIFILMDTGSIPLFWALHIHTPIERALARGRPALVFKTISRVFINVNMYILLVITWSSPSATPS